MADGSITYSTKLDNKELERQLAKETKHIEQLENKLLKNNNKRMPIAENVEELGVKLDAAKEKYASLQDEAQRVDAALTGANADDPASIVAYTESLARQKSLTKEISEQEKIVDKLQGQFDRSAQRLEAVDADAKRITTDLNAAKDKAGELSEKLYKPVTPADEMAQAVNRANEGIEKFSKRIGKLAKRVFVFTLITAALRSVKEYVWNAIQTNDEAMASIAKLKGALRTLAQPILNVVIPAFTALVRVLASVASAMARITASIFGTTVKESAAAAENLYKEQNALKGVGGAAKKAGKSLAAFDEINMLSSSDASASGGSGSSDIAPDFSFLGDVSDQMNRIAKAVMLIATGLALWKISDALPKKLGAIGIKLAGVAIAVGGLILMFAGLKDAWENGLDWGNMLEILSGAAAIIGGLYLVFGKAGAAIGLVVSGLAALVIGFKDAMANGVNLQNTLMMLTGILAAGLGISLLVGSWIPMLIAAIAAVLLAITSLMGNGDQLIANLKQAFSGLVTFLDGLIHNDIDKMLSGLKNLFSGEFNAILTIVGSVVNLIIRGLNFLIDKINTIKFDVPDWVPVIGGGKFGFNLPHIDDWKIPQLAQGAVIPPNRAFMAVLGDQKSGVNIETPLDTMVQAFKTAMNESGYGSGRIIENVLMLDGEVIYRNQQQLARRRGINLAEG